MLLSPIAMIVLGALRCWLVFLALEVSAKHAGGKRCCILAVRGGVVAALAMLAQTMVLGMQVMRQKINIQADNDNLLMLVCPIVTTVALIVTGLAVSHRCDGEASR